MMDLKQRLDELHMILLDRLFEREMAANYLQNIKGSDLYMLELVKYKNLCILCEELENQILHIEKEIQEQNIKDRF